jgi:hypothetical protein
VTVATSWRRVNPIDVRTRRRDDVGVVVHHRGDVSREHLPVGVLRRELPADAVMGRIGAHAVERHHEPDARERRVVSR